MIGGAALWLIDTGTPEQQAASWEFLKFMAAAEQQISWHTGSGYFPVRVDLQDDAELNTFWDENPNFRTAIEQLASTNTVVDGNTNYPVVSDVSQNGVAKKNANGTTRFIHRFEKLPHNGHTAYAGRCWVIPK